MSGKKQVIIEHLPKDDPNILTWLGGIAAAIIAAALIKWAYNYVRSAKSGDN